MNSLAVYDWCIASFMASSARLYDLNRYTKIEISFYYKISIIKLSKRVLFFNKDILSSFKIWEETFRDLLFSFDSS